jgi:hypothetical protein
VDFPKHVSEDFAHILVISLVAIDTCEHIFKIPGLVLHTMSLVLESIDHLLDTGGQVMDTCGHISKTSTQVSKIGVHVVDIGMHVLKTPNPVLDIGGQI